MSGQLPAILLTGTSRGIGRALAEHYTTLGYPVHGCSRSDPDGADLPGYTHFTLDICDERAVKAMFKEIRRRPEPLGVLINNAGIAAMNHALLTPTSTVERLLATNVTATFTFTREAAKLMRKERFGRIVNMVSVAVPLKLAGEAAYAASKAAVLSLTQVLARELAPLGITVNALGPTPIDTDLIRGVPQEKLERLLAQQAIPRYGTMRDFANAVDFFSRPESDFITGQVLYLGGV